MEIREIASEIARREGHKSETRIGDIREIISILSDLSHESLDYIAAILKLGESRAKRKKSSK